MAKKTEEHIAPYLKPANNIPYLVAVMLMSLFGLIAFVLLAVFRPDLDIVITGGVVFGVVSNVTLGLMTFMKSQETHLAVNSGLHEWVKSEKDASRAEGQVEGRNTANERTDMLAKEKK